MKAAPADDRWLDEVRWNADGLVAVVAQDAASGLLLTQAWMNREALALTVAEGRAVYWSRSRARLWRKGEQSGNVQRVEEIRLDCDRDALLLRVRQDGGVSCHTGRASCFYFRLDASGWQAADPVLKDPRDMYGEEQARDE